MTKIPSITRRSWIKNTVFGLLATSPSLVYARNLWGDAGPDQGPLHDRYPAIRLDIASEVVGVSHFNLERLKELVDPRPELAKATWDWGFGDWESAMDAASHVGRTDIVEYLISKGASPTLFTFAMYGNYNAVKTMTEAFPGIQRNPGPHGISLLQHAKLALTLEGTDKSNAQRLVDYLEILGDADGRQYLNMDDTEKEKYLGDYRYGEGESQGFTVKLNMKNMLSLGRLGKSGGSLYRISEQGFSYNGMPSVTVSFELEGGKVISLTVTEPGSILKAVKTG